MTGTDPHTDDLDPLMGEALHWVVRLTSGSATQADAVALKKWREQGPEYEEAFREAAAFRKTVRAMKLPPPSAIRAGNITLLRPKPLHPVSLNRRALLAGGGAIAASAAAVMVLRPPLGLWPSLAELTADHRTGLGERRHIKLAGGTTIDLNARSALSITNNGRGVTLVTGEAFIAVSEAQEAFVIKVAGEQFASRAAKFNVRTSERETCVTCLAGVIEQGDGNKHRLRAGDELVMAPDGESRVEKIDTVNAASWRQGLLVFRNTPLALALEDINRYRSGKIILTDSALARRPVNGIFHTDQIDNAVAQIRQLLRVRVQELPGGVILMG